MFRSVAVIVPYDRSGRLLLQYRKFYSKYGEEWGLFGGGIEPGETPEEALARELAEELGWVPSEYEYVGMFVDEMPLISKELEFHVFVAKMPDISILKQREGDGMGILTIDQVKKIVEMEHYDPAMIEAVWARVSDRLALERPAVSA